MHHNCNHNCTDCSGCGKDLLLTPPELALLQDLGQVPFLPVARRADDMTPVYLEKSGFSTEDYALALQLLERKALIRIDYDKPLAGADMTAYSGYPIHGSFALTARGQAVLDLLDKQGIREE